MSTNVTPKPGSQLWGIYHTDREYARESGDPLRTTIEAPTKIAAEEAAVVEAPQDAHVRIEHRVVEVRQHPSQAIRHLTQRVDRGIRICAGSAEHREQLGEATQTLMPFSRRWSESFGHG